MVGVGQPGQAFALHQYLNSRLPHPLPHEYLLNVYSLPPGRFTSPGRLPPKNIPCSLLDRLVDTVCYAT